MSFRILHLADVHLDMPFRDSGQATLAPSARREGLRQALRRAFDLARERRADAITIGGDLFEAECVTPDTGQFLCQLFQQAAPLTVLIAPGNHDPFTRNSPYNYLDWSPNVHVFDEPRLKPFALHAGVEVWGAAHDSPAMLESLVPDQRLTDAPAAVLLLHGTDRDLNIGQSKKALCPLFVADVERSGFGLALLGHIHHQNRKVYGRCQLCYPGSPEPLGFDEEVGHSVLLAEWTGAEWQVEAIDISRWMYGTAELDVGDLSSREQVIERARQLWPAERQTKHCLVRIVLTGQPERTLDLDREAIRAALKTDFHDLTLVDETLPPFDLEALAAEATTTGVFVSRLRREIAAAQQAQDDDRAKCLEKALRFGLLALEGREVPEP